MAVKAHGHESGDDRRAMPLTDGIPGEQDKKSRHGFGPRVNGLANEIGICDVEQGRCGKKGVRAKAGAKN
jgi:hypothetical protein